MLALRMKCRWGALVVQGETVIGEGLQPAYLRL